MERQEIQFYKHKVNQYRGTPGQVGYGSTASQMTRLEMLVELLPVGKFSILDFGCGCGAFYGVARSYGIDVSRYIGIDAIEENIEDACSEFPEGDFRLLNWGDDCMPADTLTKESIDLVVFSGPFATTAPDVRSRYLKDFLEHTHYGMVGNFLTYNKRVEKYEDGCVLTSVKDVLDLIDTSVFKVVLRADYMPHDFTVSAVRWEPKS